MFGSPPIVLLGSGIEVLGEDLMRFIHMGLSEDPHSVVREFYHISCGTTRVGVKTYKTN